MQNPTRPPGNAAVPDPSQTRALVSVPAQTAPHPTLPYRDAHGRIVAGGGPLNPKGRPKGIGARVREMVDFDKAIETLVDIAWGKLAPASRVADRIKAIELLFDRAFGKAAQVVDLKDGDTAARAHKFKQMDTTKLIATVEAMRALAQGTTTAEPEE